MSICVHSISNCSHNQLVSGTLHMLRELIDSWHIICCDLTQQDIYPPSVYSADTTGHIHIAVSKYDTQEANMFMVSTSPKLHDAIVHKCACQHDI